MTERRSTPVRSCVGCGKRSPQAGMIRFVAAGADLRADTTHRQPGRGAYLHREPACWDAFIARKPLVKSLRQSIHRPARAAFVLQLRDTESR